MIYNMIALVLSTLALASSTALAFRQAGLMKRSNHLPAYLAFLEEFRTDAFHQRYHFICNRLNVDHDPRNGISGLPDNVRDTLYDVAYFHQNLAALFRLGILDDQIIVTMSTRFVRVWDAIEPFVLREREIVSIPHMLRVLQDFADDVRTTPQEQGLLRHLRNTRKADRNTAKA
ncbi:hypothetical protein Aph01nite_48000 [Acrocarpospora phusangensis]|uniref:DUF4760 domain-containing protein n=1 Tax=Acrocarpospora phusangensis TaxID=1070424 RepID=A0A919QFL0_9ACTN|nr:hypothetical protein [Acrocarpospora phusangensis]GIH26490.1 hypothetical protein Aph01nite_48000 [Acrocarpospora phusangensis]